MKYKKCFLAIPFLLAQSLAPMSAYAIEGIDKVRILEITTVKTDTAYSTAAVVATGIGAAVASVGLAVVTGGVSAAVEAGAAGAVFVSAGTAAALAGGAAVVTSGTAGVYGAYKVRGASKGSADDLYAEFYSAMNPTNFHYVQNTHGSKKHHEMNVGSFIRPPEKFALNVVAWPSGTTDHDAAYLELYEYDSGSADDYLGKLAIRSFRHVAKYESKLVNEYKGDKIYTDVAEVRPPEDSEDDSIYLVTYSVEKDAGGCHHLSSTERMLHKKWYPHAEHHCK